MSGLPMLQLEGVGKSYAGSVDAVADLDLEVFPGEFMFLLGPSGSGKTTTLRMIAGFVHPTSGHIKLNGQPIADVPTHRRSIGMVFQRYALFPHLTVAQNVGFGPRMRGMREHDRPQRIAQTLALVRLAGLEDRFPHQLSGGQQQRVALARALAYRPSLLLLDEPLANLDRRLRDEMRVELKRIQRDMGTTTLFVTHDQEEALTLGDRIAVMNNGRIVQVGTPLDIYRKPASRFVASFIGDMNFLPGRVVAADAQQDTSTVQLRVGGRPQRVAGQFAAGDELSVCIRPERVVIRRADADPQNQPGRGAAAMPDGEFGERVGSVGYVGFGGDAIRYVVNMPGNQPPIFSQQPADPAMPVYAVGDRVMVGWDEGVLGAFPAATP